MSQNRNLSIHADNISSAGILNPAGGGLGISTTPANGQIPIGNGTNYTAATLTAGTGISVTNGSGSIVIASTIISGQIQNQLFTSSGTWTAPTGVTKVRATVIGGGGGSNAYSGNSFSGGAGGAAVGIYTVTPGTSYSVTVGAGGAGTGGVNAQGGTGGTSSFGSFVSATGGGGGNPYNGIAGIGSNGNLLNSVNNGVNDSNSYHPSISYFRSAGAGTNGNNSLSPITWSTTFSFTALYAGSGGQSSVGGGTSGVVFLEWVG